MGKYNVGEIWWIHFPYSDKDEYKRRPAIVIDDDTIAILALYVTTKGKEYDPYCIFIDDWKEAGLRKESWTKIDKVVSISEWYFDSKIGELTDRDLAKILQLTKEILSNTIHEFSLIVIRNEKEQFLQKYDERWSSWLFPYVKGAENNKENVDTYLSNMLGNTVSSKYVASARHCKYSVSDSVYKIYNHKLYEIKIDTYLQNEVGVFMLDGDKYRWMSINDIENDDRIMEVNEEVVAFVKSKCN